jgi:hypothetical protein
MPGNKAYNGGHADGVFKRKSDNPHPPYTDYWHDYNNGYILGRLENIDTNALKAHKESE